MFRPPPLPRTLEAALRDVTDANPRVRCSAIVDLVRHADCARPSIISALEHALKDSRDDVRAAAALALADLGAAEALPSLLFAVEDESTHVRQMALTALGEIGDARARERLRRALTDARPEIRFQAVVAFSRVAPDEADQAIGAALEDDDAHVRHVAIRTAEEWADQEHRSLTPSIVERLRALVGDPDPAVRVAAAVALARFGDVSGQALLLDVVARRLVTPEIEDEAAAVELVGELRLEEAIGFLERRAFGASRFFRQTFAWQATVALARLGQQRAVASIARDLGASSRDRRTMAVAAAGRAGLVELLERIEPMLGVDALADQDAVAEALEKLRATADRPLPLGTESCL